MTVSRVCLVLLLVVSLESVAGKPFWGSWDTWWCDLFCDDYDDTTTTTAADDDDDCGDCRPQRRTTTTPMPTTAASTTAVAPGPNPSQISVDIPSGSSGYTVVLTNNGNKWDIMMAPKPDQAATTGATTVVTTTAAGATTAAATTAAGATTAAPASTSAATTAAGK